MVSRRQRFGSVLLLIAAGSTALVAGPPFQTDDPEPVPWRHFEAYLFGTVDRSVGASAWTLPAMEFNVGAAPNLQLHLVIPGAYVTPGGAYGLGDMELGVKYRFIQESATRPQVGIFPMLEVPTGNSARGLGNGQVWARLPVWLQKSYGQWTTYGGVGYQVNRAVGMENSTFGGWLVQRQLGKRLVLGSEVYYQSSQTIGGRPSTFVDPGGYFNIRDDFSLLFMLGHTVGGETHTVGYLGLYYTWGPGRPGSSQAANRRYSGLSADLARRR
jgi:hypothetical protein